MPASRQWRSIASQRSESPGAPRTMSCRGVARWSVSHKPLAARSLAPDTTTPGPRSQGRASTPSAARASVGLVALAKWMTCSPSIRVALSVSPVTATRSSTLPPRLALVQMIVRARASATAMPAVQCRRLGQRALRGADLLEVDKVHHRPVGDDVAPVERIRPARDRDDGVRRDAAAVEIRVEALKQLATARDDVADDQPSLDQGIACLEHVDAVQIGDNDDVSEADEHGHGAADLGLVDRLGADRAAFRDRLARFPPDD